MKLSYLEERSQAPLGVLWIWEKCHRDDWLEGHFGPSALVTLAGAQGLSGARQLVSDWGKTRSRIFTDPQAAGPQKTVALTVLQPSPSGPVQ